MSAAEKTGIVVEVARRWGLTLDGWAVLAAFLVALFVRLGVLKRVPW